MQPIKVAAIAYKRIVKLMGNRFEITVVGDDADIANDQIDIAIQEIARIEQLLTTYNDESETSTINAYAGIAPVIVSDEVLQLIKRAEKISVLTQGAFDITYGGIDKRLWNFDKELTELPHPEDASKSVQFINFRNVIVDDSERTVFLKLKGMRIGFGGIGKGYAAEQAKKILQQYGVVSGIVNAAGDLTAWGVQPDGNPWTIGIADPNAARHPFSWLNITNMAVATSGNYEKFAIIKGKKYSHTIDPKTGLPVEGIKSVTIISSNAELADAMATPIMIMGIDVGLNLIDQVNGLACIIVDDDNRIHTSKNITLK